MSEVTSRRATPEGQRRAKKLHLKSRYEAGEAQRAHSNTHNGEASRHTFNASATNRLKMRQDFITMQHEYQNTQMSSALAAAEQRGAISTIRRASQRPSPSNTM